MRGVRGTCGEKERDYCEDLNVDGIILKKLD
jgi:hypothetical protein